MSDAIMSSVVQNYEAAEYAIGSGGVSVNVSTREEVDVALMHQYSEAQLVGQLLAGSNAFNNPNGSVETKKGDQIESNHAESVEATTSGMRNILLHDDATTWQQDQPQQQAVSGIERQVSNTPSTSRFGGMEVGNTYRPPTGPFMTSTGELRSCLSRNAPGAQKRVGRRVRFPEDGMMITGAMPPTDPWRMARVCSTEELVNSYRLACESQLIRTSPFVEEQLKTISLHDVGERHGGLCLKNVKLDARHCEALEQVLRRVRFVTLDLENTQLEDDSACMLFDMIEFYESAVRLSIAHNVRLTLRGWLACARMLKMTQSIEYLDARHCIFNEHTITVLARALKLVTQLSVLHLEHAAVSGRVLATLVAALRQNDSVRELYLSDNRLLPSDGVHLASLLKFNRTIQLLDLRNNTLQDVGLMHLCEGLAEQTSETGLRTLILWNNQITHYSMAAFGRALALAKCVESVNVGSNNVNNEGVHQLKDGLLKNKSLLHFGLKAAKIGCEGAVALAEYIAECPQLQRVDLRGNDIRTGGLMALSLALRVNRTLQQVDLDREPKREPGVEDYAITQKRLLDSIAEYIERNVQIVKLKEEVKQLLERQAESVKHSVEHSAAVAAPPPSDSSADAPATAAGTTLSDPSACDAESAADIGVGEESTTHTDDPMCYANEPTAAPDSNDSYKDSDDGSQGKTAESGAADDEEEVGPDEQIVVLAEQLTGVEMTKATLEKHQKLGCSPFSDDDAGGPLSTSPRFSAPVLLRHGSSSNSPSSSPRGSSVEPKPSIRELVMGAMSAPINVPALAVPPQRVSTSFTPPSSPTNQPVIVRNRFSVSLVSPEEMGVSRSRLREIAANAKLKAAAANIAAERKTHGTPVNEPAINIPGDALQTEVASEKADAIDGDDDGSAFR